MAGAGATELFGDRDAEKAHLGKAFPQILVVRRLAVEHGAHRLRRAFFGKEFSRRVAHLLLVVGEIEIHGVLLGLCEVFLFSSSSPRTRGPITTGVCVLSGIGSNVTSIGLGVWIPAFAGTTLMDWCVVHCSTITSSPGRSA